MRISSAYFTRQTATDMMRQQTELAKLQEQISSGKKINKPSDDPALAARSQELKQATSQLEQFDRNTTFADGRLSFEETALSSVSNVLLRMKELAIAANTDTISAKENTAFLSEVEQQFSELLDYANSMDNNGDFIFAGNKSTTKPFVEGSTINYVGDDESQTLQIGPGRSVTTSDSGSDIFQRIRNGNGFFKVGAESTNTGTGLVSQGTVIDHSALQKNDYRIEFTSSNSFNVIDTTSGTNLITAATYNDGDSIEFAGVQVNISGKPAAGDEFTVTPSRNQDLFQTVNNFIDILKQEPSNETEWTARHQKMDAFINDLDQSFDHITTKRSEVGARQRYIDSSREENSAIKFQVDFTLADIENLDYADAISKLEFQSLSLQTLQQTFARLENMSLFNYL